MISQLPKVRPLPSKIPVLHVSAARAVLASLIKPYNAFCFLSKVSPCEKYGETIRSTETSDWSDRIIGEAGDCRISPDLKAFFLLVEEYETKRNARPYLNAIKSKTSLFREKPANIIHLPSALSVSEMEERLRNYGALRAWK